MVIAKLAGGLALAAHAGRVARATGVVQASHSWRANKRRMRGQMYTPERAAPSSPEDQAGPVAASAGVERQRTTNSSGIAMDQVTPCGENP